MRRSCLAASLLGVALLLAAAGIGQAQDKPAAPGDDLKQIEAQFRRDLAATNRLAEIMRADSQGKDIRTNAEKAREQRIFQRFSTPEKLATEVRAATTILSRRADILAARLQNKDISTADEKKAYQQLEAEQRQMQRQLKAIADNPALQTLYVEMNTAQLLLRKEVDEGLLDSGPVTRELNKALASFDAQANKSKEYQAALERCVELRTLNDEGLPPWPDEALLQVGEPPILRVIIVRQWALTGSSAK